MAAKVRRLLSKPDRLRHEQAAQLRAALLPFEHDMPSQVRELVAHIDRQTAAKAGWTFIMILSRSEPCCSALAQFQQSPSNESYDFMGRVVQRHRSRHG